MTHRDDVQAALRTVKDLAQRFPTVSDADLNKVGWDDSATRHEALARAQHLGVLRPTDRPGAFESTTFAGEE